MRNEGQTTGGSAAGRNRPRLPARLFYGVVLAGVVLGTVLAPLGGWLYLEHGGDPTGRRVWGDVAKWFVVPICAMMGTTFGGLGGFVVAAVWDRRRGRASPPDAEAP